MKRNQGPILKELRLYLVGDGEARRGPPFISTPNTGFGATTRQAPHWVAGVELGVMSGGLCGGHVGGKTDRKRRAKSEGCWSRGHEGPFRHEERVSGVGVDRKSDDADLASLKQLLNTGAQWAQETELTASEPLPGTRGPLPRGSPTTEALN